MSTNSVREFYDSYWQSGDSGCSIEAKLLRSRRCAYEFGFKLLEPGANRRLLCVGCGYADEVVRLIERQFRVVAIDISQVSVSNVVAKTDADAVLGDCHNLPFNREIFDVAYMSLVLMHVSAEQAVSQVMSSLRPGGKLLIVEPLAHHPVAIVYRKLFSPFKSSPTNFLSRRSILKLAEATQAVTVQENSFYLLMPFFLPLLNWTVTERLFWRLLPLLEAVDSWLLERFSILARFAWMSTLAMTK